MTGHDLAMIAPVSDSLLLKCNIHGATSWTKSKGSSSASQLNLLNVQILDKEWVPVYTASATCNKFK